GRGGGERGTRPPLRARRGTPAQHRVAAATGVRGGSRRHDRVVSRPPHLVGDGEERRVPRLLRPDVRRPSARRGAGGTARVSVGTPAGPIRPEQVTKPWGHEILWARTARYVGKILHVRKGESLSLQYHERKEETMRVLSGAVSLEVGGPAEPRRTVQLGPGDGWHLPPGTRHRLLA